LVLEEQAVLAMLVKFDLEVELLLLDLGLVWFVLEEELLDLALEVELLLLVLEMVLVESLELAHKSLEPW
jgi:hypothetical protein